MNLDRTPQLAGRFNTLGRRFGVAFPVLCLAAALILGAAVSSESRAAPIPVPNADFETLYKPGTTITGVVAAGGWSMGVGLDCPIDNKTYEFSDSTTGDVADIPGWVGYDRPGWINIGDVGYNGGSYGRRDWEDIGVIDDPTDDDKTVPDPLHPDRFGNLQGSVTSQHNNTLGGAMAYIGNGGGWGNPAGALIVSADPLGTVDESLVYTLSMMASGNALPTVLDLLADGVALTPSSSVDPVLSGDWQEFSRTYDALSLAGHDGEDLTIVLGHGRPATGGQSHYDDVSLDAIPEPATLSLLALGSLIALRRSRRRRR